jgi:tetratricopeptide (TPR) repeat protein
MLTKKNREGQSSRSRKLNRFGKFCSPLSFHHRCGFDDPCPVVVLFLAGVLLLAGCTPAGPRALLDGQRLIERGKYSQAVERLKTATTLLPNNAHAWNYLGLAFQYAGQPAEAEKAYQRALLYNHDLTEAHYNLGCLWLEQNKTNAAKMEFMAYVLRKGNSPDGLLKLGSAQLRTRDYLAAEKSFADVLRIDKENPDALNGLGVARYHRGHAADSIGYFKRALDRHPSYRASLLNLAIVSQQSNKDRAFALEKYRAYLALKPPPPNADAVQAAARELEMELNPPRTAVPAALVQTTTNLSLSKTPAVSTDHLAEVPRTQPTTNGSRVATTTNSSKAAAPSMTTKTVGTKAIVPQPLPGSNAQLVKLAPEPVIKSGQDVPAVAVPKQPLPYERLLTNPPPLPQSGESARYSYKSPSKPAAGNHLQAERSFNEGVEAQKGHRWQEALAAYRSAAQDDPAYFEAHYNLGLSAAEAGNLPAALAAFEYALAIRPDSADARYSFALALKQANYLADSIHELDKVLVAHPDEARAHLALGNLYAQQLHDPSKARPHYLKVLEADPHNAQASAIHFWLTENP